MCSIHRPLAWLTSVWLSGHVAWLSAAETRVAFDIPAAIECRDVTPPGCRKHCPDWKVIEGRFRVSARLITGVEADIVDFVYVLASPESRLRIEDYLPNTTLESAVEGDRITVAESNESARSISGDLKVNYALLNVGPAANQTTKRSATNQYNEIAPKSLVLASGTTNRGHGVFFKLRPSKAMSLEGAKEFTFLAVVPQTWRADWCVIACSARATKRSLLQKSTVEAGGQQAHVGLHLWGDREARQLAAELFDVQQLHAPRLSKTLAKESAELLTWMQDAPAANGRWGSYDQWFRKVFGAAGDAAETEKALAALAGVQTRLAAFAASPVATVRLAAPVVGPGAAPPLRR